MFYMIYIFIYKKELFEIRNSPLHLFATQFGKALYCLKFGCFATGSSASFIAAGVSFDTTTSTLR